MKKVKGVKENFGGNKQNPKKNHLRPGQQTEAGRKPNTPANGYGEPRYGQWKMAETAAYYFIFHV